MLRIFPVLIIFSVCVCQNVWAQPAAQPQTIEIKPVEIKPAQKIQKLEINSPTTNPIKQLNTIAPTQQPIVQPTVFQNTQNIQPQPKNFNFFKRSDNSSTQKHTSIMGTFQNFFNNLKQKSQDNRQKMREMKEKVNEQDEKSKRAVQDAKDTQRRNLEMMRQQQAQQKRMMDGMNPRGGFAGR